MGWRDESTPQNAPTSMAPVDTTAPASQSGGWRDQSDPLGTTHVAPVAPPPTLTDQAENFGRVAANSLGVGDRLVAGWKTILPAMYPSVFGQNGPGGKPATDAATLDAQNTAAVTAERAKTAEASKQIGPLATVGANIVGTLPLAALGAGAGATEAAATILPRYAAGIVGYGAEGAGTGWLSATGRGEDPTTATLLGGLFGMGGGALGGTGRGGAVPQAADRTALEADQAAKLAALKQPKFDPSDVDTAYRDAVVSLDPAQRANVSYGMRQNVIRNRAENARTGGTSAADINGFARNPFDSVRTNGDGVLAARIRDNLTGPQGILATANPITSHAPGEALDLHNAFQTATARLGDHDWLTNANINTAPAQAAAKLQSGSGMLYDQAGRDAMQRLADMAPKSTTPTSGGAGAWQGAKNFVSDTLSNKALTSGVGWLLHGLTGSAVPLGVQGAAAIAKGARTGVKVGDVQAAIDAAKVATTTGRPTTPFEMLPPAPMRDFARKILNTGGANF